MNFQSLKGVIDTLVKTFKCPECNSEVSDAGVDIMGAAGNTVNIDIACSNCGKHSMLKTEVLSVKLGAKVLTAENIEKLKQSLNIGKLPIGNSAINDDEIVGLNKDLNKNKLNVSELFGED